MRQSITRFGLIIGLTVSVISGTFCQAVNPFEIRSRLDSVARLPVTEQIDTSASRPENNVILPSPEEVTIAEQNSGVNPFDVDHQPLRKPASSVASDRAVPSSGAQSAKSSSNTFIFWVLLMAAAFLAIVLNVRFAVIQLAFRSLININLFKLFHREEGGKITLSNILLYSIFIINTAVLGYLFLKGKNLMSGPGDLVNIAALITLFYLLKHVLILTLGSIFSVEKSASLYNFSIFSYHVFLGIILLPINLTAAFAPGFMSTFFINIALLCVALVIILKVARGLIISLEFWGDRFFQFFMYLCTFEILPVLILVKFLLYQVNL